MSTPVTILIYTALVFATSAIGSLTGIGGGVVRKPVFDAMGDFSAAEIAFLNVVTVLAMSLVSILRQSKNFRFEGLVKFSKRHGANEAAPIDAEKSESDGEDGDCSDFCDANAKNNGEISNPSAAPTNSEIENNYFAVATSAAIPESEIIISAISITVTASETKNRVSAGSAESPASLPFASSVENTDKRPVLSVKNLLLLSAGSVAGGIGGEVLFTALVKGTPDNEVKLVQNVVLLALVLAVLGYMIFKSKIPTAHLKRPVWYVSAGLLLGILASFLGIGGGPMNLAVLMLMFSMSTKEAAYSSLAIILVSQASKLIISAISGTILVVTAQLVYTSVGFLTVGAIAGGLIGSFLSKKLSDKAVSISFDLLQIALIAIVVYNIVRAVGNL